MLLKSSEKHDLTHYGMIQMHLVHKVDNNIMLSDMPDFGQIINLIIDSSNKKYVKSFPFESSNLTLACTVMWKS